MDQQAVFQGHSVLGRDRQHRPLLAPDAGFRTSIFCAAFLLMSTADLLAQPIPKVAAETVGINAETLAEMEPLIDQAIENHQMPGCVVCVGYQGQIVLLEAIGNKRLLPEPQPMTTDTVFDLASLTKPVATATSVMILVDRGELQLDQTVASLFPDFAVNDKQNITIQHLLTHQSGLLPDNALSDYADGPEQAFTRIHALPLQVPVGSKFIYSDVNFILLGEIVQRVSGKPLAEFTQENLFEPLQMNETGYVPSEPLRARAAPTQQREGHWMQGEVHDPRAFALSGVAGHAGVFSTASDLARFAQMLLNQGELNGTRILSPQAVQTMTQDYAVSSGIRGLGWDKRTGYSSNRGEALSDAAFGHGGFTGTVLWVDPQSQFFFVFLSNRVHPDGHGSVNRLAGHLVEIAERALPISANQSKPQADTPDKRP